MWGVEAAVDHLLKLGLTKEMGKVRDPEITAEPRHREQKLLATEPMLIEDVSKW